MRQRGLAPIIILIFIALAVATVYFLGTKNILKLPTSLPLSILSPSPSPTSDPTAIWKTYTNREFGFTFKYPGGWEVRDFGKVNPSDLLNIGIAPITVKEDVFGGVLVTTEDVNSKISGIKNPPNKYSGVVSEKQISFPDYTATEIIVENTLAKVESKYLIFSKDQKTFVLSGGGAQDNSMIYQILSTFKFTD